MPISEGVSATVVVKKYAGGEIAATEPVLATAPGATGGQQLRRVSVSLNLVKSSFSSQEMRPDFMQGDLRHGMRKAEGTITGELSPGTYFSLFEAAHRDTATAGAALTNTGFTSITADASASTLVLAGGDPVASGLRVGDIVTLTVGAGANLGKSFVVTGFSGTSNRTLGVSPPPATVAALTTFTLSRPGKSTMVPASGHTKSRWAIEVNHNDTDMSRLFSEARFHGYSISMPSEGLCGVEFSTTARNMHVLTGGSAPFFTSPAAITTSGICAAAQGVLRVSNQPVALITGVTIDFSAAVEAPTVVAASVTPDILIGPAMVSGTIQAFIDPQFIGYFVDETEFDILLQVSSDGSGTHGIAIHLPRVKLSGANVDVSGNGGTVMSLPFTALRYNGSAPGFASTVIKICDTQAV